MRLAISGTYSSGKTRTVMALSHYTGIPRTLAKAIREILPDAVPGKRLAECTPAEFLQLMMRRHADRVAREAVVGEDFISDGSSLQEWLYGAARVVHGMNPDDTAHLDGSPPEDHHADMPFFEKVVAQFGHAMRQHVAGTFDAFVHLRHEFPIADDGHRPMKEEFRATIDEMLLATLREMKAPLFVVGGSLEERLEAIADRFDLPRVMTPEEAVQAAARDYARIDLRLETERAGTANA